MGEDEHGGYTPGGRIFGVLLIFVSATAIVLTCIYTIVRVMGG